MSRPADHIADSARMTTLTRIARCLKPAERVEFMEEQLAEELGEREREIFPLVFFL